MKRIAAIFIVLMTGASLSFGQDILKEYGYALYGGVNFSTFDKEDINTSSIQGFNLGAAVEIPITANFSIQPGIELSLKGGKYNRMLPGSFGERPIVDEEGEPVDLDEDGFQDIEIIVTDTIHQLGVIERLLYLQVPVLAYTHFEVGDGKVFFAAGPYVGIGLYSRANAADDTNKKALFYAKRYKQLDYGVQIKAGYELPSGWFVSAGYEYGMANISKNVMPVHKTYNRNISLTVGRKIWGY